MMKSKELESSPKSSHAANGLRSKLRSLNLTAEEWELLTLAFKALAAVAKAERKRRRLLRLEGEPGHVGSLTDEQRINRILEILDRARQRGSGGAAVVKDETPKANR